MFRNKTIVTDEKERESRLNKLFLVVNGLRDLSFCGQAFNEFKNSKLGETSVFGDLTKFNSFYVFIICYGRIFTNSKGIGKLE